MPWKKRLTNVSGEGLSFDCVSFQRQLRSVAPPRPKLTLGRARVALRYRRPPDARACCSTHLDKWTVGADTRAAPSGHHTPPAVRNVSTLPNTSCGGAWWFRDCWVDVRSAPRPQTIPVPCEIRSQALCAYRRRGAHVERGHPSNRTVDRQHLHTGAATARLQYATG